MRKKSFLRILFTVVILVGIVGLIGWVLKKNKAKNEAKTAVVAQSSNDVAVRISTVSKQSVETGFSANGNFAPAQQLNFAAENSGRVVRVLVDEGSYVRKGQTLAIIKA